MVVDHVPAPAGVRLAPWQGHQFTAAEEQHQPVSEQMHVQEVTDQPRRHRVEHLAQGEPGVQGDPHLFALEVLEGARRQRLQRGALGVDEHAVAGVVAADEFGDEAAVSVRIVKLTRAAQQQGLVEGALEVAVEIPEEP